MVEDKGAFDRDSLAEQDGVASPLHDAFNFRATVLYPLPANILAVQLEKVENDITGPCCPCKSRGFVFAHKKTKNSTENTPLPGQSNTLMEAPTTPISEKKAASLANLRPWKPGQSGNPRGRAPCRQHSVQDRHRRTGARTEDVEGGFGRNLSHIEVNKNQGFRALSRSLRHS